MVATGVHCVDSPAIAGDGTVYVTCSGSRGQQTPVSVYRISVGGVREIFATGVTNATSLAFDPLGRLHVTSRFDGTVSRLDASGRPEVVAGDLGVATGLVVRARWRPSTSAIAPGRSSGSRQAATPSRTPPCRPASRRSTWRSPPTDDTLYATAPTLAPRDAVYRIRAGRGRRGGHARASGGRRGSPSIRAGRLYVVEALAGAAGVYEVSDDGASELVVAGSFVGLAFGGPRRAWSSPPATPSTCLPAFAR